MAYNRQPQTVLAGMALKQNPPPNVVQPAGIIPVTLDAEIATTTSPGVVQVGSGLSITPGGQSEDMDIWLRENGVDFPDTNTGLTIFGNESILLAGWSYLLQLDAGDYLELVWQAPSTDIQLFTLPAQIDPTRPVTPSARVTVIEV
jgi:hypothetical protein